MSLGCLWLNTLNLCVDQFKAFGNNPCRNFWRLVRSSSCAKKLRSNAPPKHKCLLKEEAKEITQTYEHRKYRGLWSATGAGGRSANGLDPQQTSWQIFSRTKKRTSSSANNKGFVTSLHCPSFVKNKIVNNQLEIVASKILFNINLLWKANQSSFFLYLTKDICGLCSSNHSIP